MKINNREIGDQFPPYIIAEISGNHNGKLERVFEMIQAAKNAGADAVKLQTYTPDTLTINHDSPEFIIDLPLWKGQKLYDLYQEASTPWDWHQALFQKAKEIGITIFSTPFDYTAVDFLEELNAPAYKIASFENIDIPLIERVAETGKPLIISTGMATLDEIDEMVDATRSKGCQQLCLLHCVSAYPAPLDQANLAHLKALKEKYKICVGLSDHTMGTIVSSTACALGANVIEKHFTLSRADGGVDSAFSLEPSELEKLVQDCQAAYQAIGEASFKVKPSEIASLTYRRSLYVVKDIKQGEVFTKDNVRSIRPSFGLKPKYFNDILGKKAKKNLFFGEPLSWDVID